MRSISGLWRWRHNPLRRTTDLAEAWVALAALLLILVAAPLIGSLVGRATGDILQKSVQEQHRSRHLVTATVVRKLDRSPLEADPEASAGRDMRTRVLADWPAPDGTTQQGPVLASLKNPAPGDHFRIWTDGHGRMVARPLDSATAATHAMLAGFGAALAAAGLVEGGRRLILWRMVRRRYARLDQAWDKAGPDWGKTGTGC
ncbi:hypothetical protein [Streptomyces sp. TRM68367]|uniref:Rv1733c family protein n=1 Tax=Streptomyces sp. TRM68367 TaxID=2758415 RepID=UPI00165B6072|nr:hypothetical protein [Streptomyces sp. TRM68367]MBC9725382.1 hypothetical protein [Streptomyces sp. TRM68367]